MFIDDLIGLLTYQIATIFDTNTLLLMMMMMMMTTTTTTTTINMLANKSKHYPS